MSNYFFEQLRIRKQIAREQWEAYRAALTFEVDTTSDDLQVWASSISFAEYWAIEFDRWMNNAATDCMQRLGTYGTPLRSMN